MTYFTLPHRQSRVVSALAAVGHSISQVFASVSAGLDARDAYDRYSIMSDAQLARRGITREEIPYLIMRRHLSRDS